MIRRALPWVLCTLLSGCASTPPQPFPIEDKVTAGIFLDLGGRPSLPPGVELRKVYPKGLEITKVSEAWRSRLYNDAANFCTIGYGHLVKRAPCDNTEPDEFVQGITEPRGTEILLTDMERAEIAVMLGIKSDLTDGQFAALCDFVFNVGVTNFQNSTLRTVVNARQFERVPGQLLRWVRAGDKVLQGLRNRRQREIDLFFDGIPAARAAPPVGEDLSPIDIRTGE